MGGRVVVAEPGLPLDVAVGLLEGTGAIVDRGGPPWSVPADVVALLIGPGVPVRAVDLDRLPSLRVVATCSVGFDHVELGAAARRGIWVCHVPDYCMEEMADHALALLLALLRGVVELDRSVREGRWDHRAAGTLRRIAGTPVGVVGCGRIGRAFAARAAALGCDVLGTDPLVPPEVLSAQGIRPTSLDDLLAASAGVSLHAALTADTRGMIGEREIALMPPGSVLVNTARAALVDPEALLRALDSGHLAGAALDVLWVEPPRPLTPPPRRANLIVTPHAGWFSAEAEQEVYRRAVLAVRAVLEGREPPGAVAGPS